MTPTTPSVQLAHDDAPGVLLGDRDHDVAAAIIAQAYREGRLEDDDHEQRAGLAQTARTRAELDAALDGIPARTAVSTTDPASHHVAREADGVDTGGRSVVYHAVWLLVVAFAAAMITAPMWWPSQFPASDTAAVERTSDADLARQAWPDVNAVVKAERARYARTGRYTEDWTTLTVTDPYLVDLADAGIDVEVTDDRKGAVVTYDDFDVYLTAVLDGGKITRKCETGGDASCPVVPKAKAGRS